MSAKDAPTDDGLTRAVEQFLYHEARLLDAGAFEDWLALFDADGVYWVPAEPGQKDPEFAASIMYEDTAILAMRIERLKHPRAPALAPMPRSAHIVSNVTASVGEGDLIDAQAAFLMTEARQDDLRTFAGGYQYRLRRDGSGFRIKEKRVDLVNCDAVMGAINLPI